VMIDNVPVEEKPPEHVGRCLHMLPAKNINSELLRAIVISLKPDSETPRDKTLRGSK